MSTVTSRAGHAVLAISTRKHRLIGLALMRIIIGLTTILYCLSDYPNRQFLWGPHSYDSPQVARAFLSHWSFSLFFVSNSQIWFEVLFHLVIIVSLAFTVFGGHRLTAAQAVLLWSLHNRNQDVLEGGDNLTQIIIIFMCLCTTNAYFAPGAKRRRDSLAANPAPSSLALLHNLAAFAVVFQVCVLYFVAGYWKITGPMWQNGTAMYYISRITAFAMSGTVAHLMSSALLTTAVCYATIAIELAFPFTVLSARPWLRKANIVAIEGMHLGIMAFMGLVCFGLIMMGADGICLRDSDYLAMTRRARQLSQIRTDRRRKAPLAIPAPAPAI